MKKNIKSLLLSISIISLLTVGTLSTYKIIIDKNHKENNYKNEHNLAFLLNKKTFDFNTFKKLDRVIYSISTTLKMNFEESQNKYLNFNSYKPLVENINGELLATNIHKIFGEVDDLGVFKETGPEYDIDAVLREKVSSIILDYFKNNDIELKDTKEDIEGNIFVGYSYSKEKTSPEITVSFKKTLNSKDETKVFAIFDKLDLKFRETGETIDLSDPIKSKNVRDWFQNEINKDVENTPNISLLQSQVDEKYGTNTNGESLLIVNKFSNPKDEEERESFFLSTNYTKDDEESIIPMALDKKQYIGKMAENESIKPSWLGKFVLGQTKNTIISKNGIYWKDGTQLLAPTPTEDKLGWDQEDLIFVSDNLVAIGNSVYTLYLNGNKPVIDQVVYSSGNPVKSSDVLAYTDSSIMTIKGIMIPDSKHKMILKVPKQDGKDFAIDEILGFSNTGVITPNLIYDVSGEKIVPTGAPILPGYILKTNDLFSVTKTGVNTIDSTPSSTPINTIPNKKIYFSGGVGANDLDFSKGVNLGIWGNRVVVTDSQIVAMNSNDFKRYQNGNLAKSVQFETNKTIKLIKPSNNFVYVEYTDNTHNLYNITTGENASHIAINDISTEIEGDVISVSNNFVLTTKTILVADSKNNLKFKDITPIDGRFFTSDDFLGVSEEVLVTTKGVWSNEANSELVDNKTYYEILNVNDGNKKLIGLEKDQIKGLGYDKLFTDVEAFGATIKNRLDSGVFTSKHNHISYDDGVNVDFMIDRITGGMFSTSEGNKDEGFSYGIFKMDYSSIDKDAFFIKNLIVDWFELSKKVVDPTNQNLTDEDIKKYIIANVINKDTVMNKIVTKPDEQLTWEILAESKIFIVSFTKDTGITGKLVIYIID